MQYLADDGPKWSEARRLTQALVEGLAGEVRGSARIAVVVLPEKRAVEPGYLDIQMAYAGFGDRYDAFYKLFLRFWRLHGGARYAGQLVRRPSNSRFLVTISSETRRDSTSRPTRETPGDGDSHSKLPHPGMRRCSESMEEALKELGYVQ